MIRTFYSNSFEALQTILNHQIKTDLDVLRASGGSIFDEIPVIASTPLIAERLKRGFADFFSVTPGIDFKNPAQWMYLHFGQSLSNNDLSALMDWLLFDLLKKKRDESAKAPEDFEERLKSYLCSMSDAGILEFSRHLNNVFVTYGSYRIDWLYEWIEEKRQSHAKLSGFPVRPEEKKRLALHPDYLWQKKLWQDLVERSEELRSGSPSFNGSLLGWMHEIAERLSNISVRRKSPSALHFFLPFSLPPILLPLIRAYATDAQAPDLNLYILNPSSEYWFEGVPVSLFDWKSDAGIEDVSRAAPLQYLTVNAASTRAMIDRIDDFIHSTEAAYFEADKSEEDLKASRLSERNAPAARRQFLPASEKLLPAEAAETNAVFIERANDSFLHRFQNSLLKLDASLLPEEPDAEDVSLRILLAPSFEREVEAALDILHNWLSEENADFSVSDVAILVPDIQKAAPAIEAAIASFSSANGKRLSIPWKIVGRSELSTNKTAQAFVDLCRLLTSDFAAKDFYTWLEQPAVQLQWGLSLDDAAILRTWLVAAGFKFGFDHEQLEDMDLGHEDVSLEEALERLTLGYFLDECTPYPFEDVLPVRGNEQSGFDTVSQENGRLLRTLAALYSALKDVTDRLRIGAENFTTAEWQKFLIELKDDFFPESAAPDDLFRLSEQIDFVTNALIETLGAHERGITLEVLLSELCSQLSAASGTGAPSGCVTIGEITALRALPFKIIFCLGFDELSGFPGTPKFEEFDLMKTIRRRADRDSRKDNNAVFLDALLSARERLVISYCAGSKAQSDNNPSIVIENFKTYFVSHARRKSAAQAKRLWESIVSRVPLNRFSMRNFSMDKVDPTDAGRRFWLSPRTDILDAVRGTDESGYRALPAFFDAPIPEARLPKILQKRPGAAPEERRPAVSADILIDYLKNPERWIEKALGFAADSASDENESLMLTGARTLAASVYRKRVLASSEAGARDAFLEVQAFNPDLGLPCVRTAALESLTEEVAAAHEFFNMVKGTLKGPFKLRLEEKLPEEFEFDLFIDEGDDFWEDESGRPCRFCIPTSKGDFRRHLYRQLFWCALGRPYLLYAPIAKKPTECYRINWSFPKIKDDDPLYIEHNGDSKDFLGFVLRAFARTIKGQPGLVTPEKEGERSWLWEGADEALFAEASEDSKILLEWLREDFDELLKSKDFAETLTDCLQMFGLMALAFRDPQNASEADFASEEEL